MTQTNQSLNWFWSSVYSTLDSKNETESEAATACPRRLRQIETEHLGRAGVQCYRLSQLH